MDILYERYNLSMCWSFRIIQTLLYISYNDNLSVVNKNERDLHCLAFNPLLPLFTLSVSTLAHIPSVDILKHVNQARRLKINRFPEINFVISD